MVEFLFGAAALMALAMALGMLRLLYGPTAVDRMMAAQLLGSTGGAICLLAAFATGFDAIVDVALTLALLAAFASATMNLKARSLEAMAPASGDDA
jgi:multicomponent Na+:H+ antiporter subunit F